MTDPFPTRGRGKRKSQAEINNDMAKAIDGLEKGKPLSVIAKELEVSRTTLWRNLSKLTIEMATRPENRTAFAEFRQSLIEAHLMNAQEVREGVLLPDSSNAINKSLESAAKLSGANAPVTTLTARVDGLSVRDLQLRKAASGLEGEAFDSAVKYLESLPRVVTPPVIDATWFPAKQKQIEDGEAQ